MFRSASGRAVVLCCFTLAFAASPLFGAEQKSPEPTTLPKRNILAGSDVGLIPDTGKDCTAAFTRALETARRKPATTIMLKPGEYHFWSKNAIQREHYHTNTDEMHPPKRYAILLESHRGTTIDGGGATLVMHGEMSAIGIEDSSDITLRHMNVDFARMFVTEAKVIEQGNGWQILDIDPKIYPYTIINGRITITIDGKSSNPTGLMEFDPRSGRLLMNDHHTDFDRVEQLSPDRLKVYGGLRVSRVGNVLVMRHHLRSHSGVFIENCSNVTVEQFELWATAGLGFVGQQSHDLTFRHANIRPRPGTNRVSGPKDDGFQIVGCSGHVELDSCIALGLGDDPVNVHGHYLSVERVASPDTIIAKLEQFNVGQRHWARPGEVLSIIDRQTMLPISTRTVKGFRLLDISHAEIAFTKPVDQTKVNRLVLENITATPSVTIRNCQFGNGRARGILMTTPKPVLIENCRITSPGAAIHIEGDANFWFESGACSDVTIRNNIFDNNLMFHIGDTRGVITITPQVARGVPGRYMHRNIRIVQNEFRVFDKPVLYAQFVENLSLVDNHFVRTEMFRPWNGHPAAIVLRHCANVEIRNNKVQGQLLDNTIMLEDMPAADLHLGPNALFRLKP